MRDGIFSVEALETRTLFSGTLCLPGVSPSAPKPAPAKPSVSKGSVPKTATPLGVYFGTYARTNKLIDGEGEVGAFKLIINKTRGGGLFGTMEIASDSEGVITRTAPIVVKPDGKFRVFFFSAKLAMRLEGQLYQGTGLIESKFQGLKRGATFRADVQMTRSQSIIITDGG